MSSLFGRDIKTIGKHINNALKEELQGESVVAKFATTRKYGRKEGLSQTLNIEYYNLEMITSVGFRVKSKQGVEFRKWANKVLKEYLIKGYVINQDLKIERYNELKQYRTNLPNLCRRRTLSLSRGKGCYVVISCSKESFF